MAPILERLFVADSYNQFDKSNIRLIILLTFFFWSEISLKGFLSEA